jgi:hypothetical protein
MLHYPINVCVIVRYMFNIIDSVTTILKNKINKFDQYSWVQLGGGGLGSA